MILSSLQLQELKDVASKAAKEAGAFIFNERSKQHQHIQKEGGNTNASQIVTQVDFRSQEIILSHIILTCQQFDLGLLTEEEQEDNSLEVSRLTKDYFWCIDPLDGTLPFVEGNSGYAVSIALVTNSGESIIGVIFDPVNNVLYEAVKGLGCYRNGIHWKMSNAPINSNFLFVSDRSFHTLPSYNLLKKDLLELTKRLGYTHITERQFGGAVMNAIWTIEEAPGCYVKLPKTEVGGGSIWDFAATACIFQELGIPASNCEGSPLLLNDKKTTFMNKQGVVFASNVEIKKYLIQSIGANKY